MKATWQMGRAPAIIILTIVSVGIAFAGQNQRDQESAWKQIISLSEAIIGPGGVVDQATIENKADAIVDLHAEFSKNVLGKPISSERTFVVKQGFRLFLKVATERYSGNARKAGLQLIRDLATNRSVFIELFNSANSAEVVEQHLLGYLQRNLSLSYKEPVSIVEQVNVPISDAKIRVEKSGIRMVADQGASGHYNTAIDAGELITINIPLTNRSDHPFRSTSALLETNDPYVSVAVSKVVYTERSIVGGETTTFAPGMTIAPKQNFVFSISPYCPDKHVATLNLHIGDSDFGEMRVPINIVVYNIGPINFGNAKIDDDRFGDSDGNGNSLMEVGETIEFVLPLRNEGAVEIADITANLFCSNPHVIFKSGYDVCQYRMVAPNSERPIAASFVFTLDGQSGDFDGYGFFKLLTMGTARGKRYSWLTTQSQLLGMLKVRYDKAFDLMRELCNKDNLAWEDLQALKDALDELKMSSGDDYQKIMEDPKNGNLLVRVENVMGKAFQNLMTSVVVEAELSKPAKIVSGRWAEELDGMKVGSVVEMAYVVSKEGRVVFCMIRPKTKNLEVAIRLKKELMKVRFSPGEKNGNTVSSYHLVKFGEQK